MLRAVATGVIETFTADRRVLTLAFAQLVEGIGNSFLVIVIPLYVASDLISGSTFGLEEAMIIGIVLSLYGFLNSAAQPFTGRLSDRAGKRKVFILIGLCGLGVTNLAYVFAESYAALLAIRAAQGVSTAFIVPAAIALVNELATDSDRGGNMGVYNTFRLIGFGGGPVAAGAVVAAGPYAIPTGASTVVLSGFHAAFVFAAATAAISFVLVTILIADPETTRDTTRGDTSFAIRDPTGRGLFDPVFTLGLATLFMAIGIALFATLQNEVNAALGQGAGWFGLQFAAFIVAQVVLQAPIGSASDRFGRRPFIVVGMALLVPTTLVQGFVPTSETMFLARLLQGIAGAMVFAPALALAGDLAREGESGGTLSVLTMAFGLGIALGPLTSGFLVGFGLAVPFAFGAATAALGTILVYTQVEETVDVDADTPSYADD